MMFSRWMRRLALCGLALAALGSAALALGDGAAGDDGPGRKRGIAGWVARQLAEKADLSDDQKMALRKHWKEQAEGRAGRRGQLRDAVAELRVTAESKEASDQDVSRALDKLQAALQAVVDDTLRTRDSIREVLTVEQQARLAEVRKFHEVASLPGMKEAIPSLIGYLRAQVLGGVEGLHPEARKTLEEIGQSYTSKRMVLFQARIETLEALAAAGEADTGRVKLLDQLAANTDALSATLTDQIAEVRKRVSDRETARVVLAVQSRAKGFGKHLKRLRGLTGS